MAGSVAPARLAHNSKLDTNPSAGYGPPANKTCCMSRALLLSNTVFPCGPIWQGEGEKEKERKLEDLLILWRHNMAVPATLGENERAYYIT